MSSTAKQMRTWTGPAILSFGFRPFFFGASLWAVAVMVLWVLMLSGELDLATAFDPVSWHAHELLFGYTLAVIAGFLLTAVPNWTGRLPIVGWRLGGLFGLWVLGRFAVTFSAFMPVLAVALLDLSMPLVLGAVIAREIIVGKNWRNLVVLAMLGILVLGNAVFHWEAAQGGNAAQGYGLRIGLAAVILMISVIGGRIVPSFTRNWLVRQKQGRLPVPPMQRFDKLAILMLAIGLGSWIAFPKQPVTAVLLVLVGLLHVARLARWAGERSFPEPLVTVLHVGYAFVPLGALGVGLGSLLTGGADTAAAQHLWMGGAIGLMTLAVMTRATLGHTGQSLTANAGTIAVYTALVLAVLARVAAGIWPAGAQLLLMVAGIGWIAAFGGFCVFFGPLLFRAPGGKRQR